MTNDTAPAKEKAIELLLIPADVAARLCGVSRGHWWMLHSSGRVPLPVRLGRKTLWRVGELHSWIEAGCPPREKWQAIATAKSRT